MPKAKSKKIKGQVESFGFALRKLPPLENDDEMDDYGVGKGEIILAFKVNDLFGLHWANIYGERLERNEYVNIFNTRPSAKANAIMMKRMKILAKREYGKPARSGKLMYIGYVWDKSRGYSPVYKFRMFTSDKKLDKIMYVMDGQIGENKPAAKLHKGKCPVMTKQKFMEEARQLLPTYKSAGFAIINKKIMPIFKVATKHGNKVYFIKYGKGRNEKYYRVGITDTMIASTEKEAMNLKHILYAKKKCGKKGVYYDEDGTPIGCRNKKEAALYKTIKAGLKRNNQTHGRAKVMALVNAELYKGKTPERLEGETFKNSLKMGNSKSNKKVERLLKAYEKSKGKTKIFNPAKATNPKKRK